VVRTHAVEGFNLTEAGTASDHLVKALILS